MSSGIRSLDDVLRPVLARIRPVSPVLIPVEAAIGCRLAEALASPRSLPGQSIALRTGLAVNALDLAGASIHAPVMLMSRPLGIRAGDPMPERCDAIIDPRAITPQGPFWEATESIEPGTDIRRAGHDLAEGAKIGETGGCITPEIAYTARLAGLEIIPVRRPIIRIEGFTGPEAAWLAARLSALGMQVSPGVGPTDVIIRSVENAAMRLALKPAETAWISLKSDCVVVEVPSRIDCLMAAWCVLLLPVFAALTGASSHAIELPVARKLTSQVGISEVVLYRIADGLAEPLATGDFPLSAIARANAFSLIPAGHEGYAAGTQIAATPLDHPFL